MPLENSIQAYPPNQSQVHLSPTMEFGFWMVVQKKNRRAIKGRTRDQQTREKCGKEKKQGA